MECRFEGCVNKAASKQRGLCRAHGMQLWRGGGDESHLRPLRVRQPRVSDDGQTYRCRLCSGWKPAEEFPADRFRENGKGRGRECLRCKASYMREWNAKNPESVRRTILKRRGLTPEGFASMLEAQGGVCAICGCDRPRSGRAFAVDHDHRTGRVRGLLCESCNRGIGYMGDDPERLQSAIAYLQRSTV